MGVDHRKRRRQRFTQHMVIGDDYFRAELICPRHRAVGRDARVAREDQMRAIGDQLLDNVRVQAVAFTPRGHPVRDVRT